MDKITVKPSILLAASSLKSALEAVQEKKQSWSQTIKPFLVNLLVEVKDQGGLDGLVEEVDPDSVRFSIKGANGQIIGSLLFALTYNGLVSISTHYKTFEYERPSEVDNYENIQSLALSSFNDKVAYESIGQFLGLILKVYSPKPPLTANELAGMFH